jgi:phosphonate transport system substrate-binding protein
MIVGLCLALLGPASASAQAVDNAPLRFGILPIGGPLESRKEWEPLLISLARAIGRPVQALSVTSYEALETAIRRDEVDISFLSAKMALDTVTHRTMTVVAQEMRPDFAPAYRAVLIGRKNDAPATLSAMLAAPGRWRFAGGEPQSMSAYVVPQLQLFLPNKLKTETFFISETTGSDQRTALAVANGEADVGTNSTADLERFKARFPQEYEHLAILWESDPIPPAQIVVRRAIPTMLRERIRAFLTSYGRADGAKGDAERAVLMKLHDFSGFDGAGDSSLLPAARLAYDLARCSAMSSQWVSEAARQVRLRRIDADYVQQIARLRQGDDRLPVFATR